VAARLRHAKGAALSYIAESPTASVGQPRERCALAGEFLGRVWLGLLRGGNRIREKRYAKGEALSLLNP
jgi:hypothetical protein